MSAAAVVFFVLCVLLALVGTATVWSAASGVRRRALRRAGAVLKVIAGVGTLGFAVLALSALWSEMAYGVVILPVASLIGAAVWNGVFLGAATHADRTRPGGTSK